LEDANQKGNTHFCRGAIGTRARWAGEGGYGLWEGQTDTGRAGPVRPDPSEDSKEKLIFQISTEFGFWQDIENFCHEIYKEFGHKNFFLNSSRLLKDF
jgi:hypothetical protein